MSHCEVCGEPIDESGPFAVTLRGDGVELHGKVDGLERVQRLAKAVDPILVIASPLHDTEGHL